MFNFRYKEYQTAHNLDLPRSNGEIYSVSKTLEDEAKAIDAHLRRLNTCYSSRTGRGYRDFIFDNPVFEADEDELEEDDQVTVILTDEISDNGNRIENVLIHNSLNIDTNNDCNKCDKAHSNVDCVKNCEQSQPRSKRYETWPSPKAKRKRNYTYTVPSSFSKFDRPRHVSHNSEFLNPGSLSGCRKCSSISLDRYPHQTTPRLGYTIKDNRFKSSLRNHAMANIEHSQSSRVDCCAVEALSKEDLLVLWKRSEIELQTKLNRMLHQNKHLQQLVNIAEECRRKSDDKGVISEDQAPFQISTRL